MRSNRVRCRSLGVALALVVLALPGLAAGASAPAEAAGPAPRAIFLTGPADHTPSREADFTFEADLPQVRYSVRLDGGPWSAYSRRTSARFAGLSTGNHRVALRAITPAGRAGPVAEARFVVDLTRPQTTFTGGRRAATVLRPASAIRFASSERGSSFTCRVDGGGYLPCVSPYVLKGIGAGRHRISVRATDAAGNTDPVPTTRLVTVDADASADSLFSDDFETGTLARWTVTAKDGGTAVTQRSRVRSGSYAATFTTSAAAGSTAHARATLSAATSDLTAAASIRVDAEGVAGGNVPLLRLFDTAGGRVVNVYRPNQTDQVWVQYAGTYTRTTGELPLGTWGDLALRVSGSSLQLTLDGREVLSTRASLAPVRTLQLGNEVPAQAGAVDVDDVAITSTGSDTVAPQTRITAAPSGTVASGSASFSFASSESGSSFQCSLDDTTYTTCSSPRAYSALAAGEHRFSVRAVDAAGNVDGSPASSSWTAAVTPTSAVLIADNMNRRILITDYHARVLWKFDNPTGGTSAYSGPLGVRWMANGHILATFGTGQVGEIDPVTKSFVWISSGYGSRYFKSPYDAQILPDGNLAVACARNGNGWVLVFDRATGALVWSYSINYPHLVEMIPAGKGHNTRRPTLLMAGFSQLTEAVYDPGHTGNKTVVWRWRKPHSSIHRAILDRDGHSVVVTNHDYLFKVARPRQTETWKRFQGNAVHGETRGVAMTDTGGYVLGHRVWKGASQIRFTDGQGRTRRTWTTLSDGSRLNLVWGVRTLRFPR